MRFQNFSNTHEFFEKLKKFVCILNTHALLKKIRVYFKYTRVFQKIRSNLIWLDGEQQNFLEKIANLYADIGRTENY